MPKRVPSGEYMPVIDPHEKPANSQPGDEPVKPITDRVSGVLESEPRRDSSEEIELLETGETIDFVVDDDTPDQSVRNRSEVVKKALEKRISRAPETARREKDLSLEKREAQEQLDTLELLKRSIMLHREDTVRYNREIRSFENLLLDTDRRIATLRKRATSENFLNDFLELAEAHYSGLAGFFEEESVKRVKAKEGPIPQANPDLIQTYQRAKKEAGAHKTAKISSFTALKERLGGIIIEEADELAADPSQLGMVRRGLEWAWSRIDRTYKTTSELLQHHAEVTEKAKTAERQEAELRKQIEGVKAERVSPILNPLFETLRTCMEGPLESVAQLDRFVLYVQQAEEELRQNRKKNLSYEARAPFERLLGQAQRRLEGIKRDLKGESGAQVSKEHVAKELIVLSTPQATLERKQLEQLSGIARVDVGVRKTSETLVQLFKGKRIAPGFIPRAQDLLGVLSQTEQQIAVTLARLELQQLARMEAAMAYHRSTDKEYRQIPLETRLQNARPRMDITEQLLVAPLPVERIDPMDDTAHRSFRRVSAEVDISANFNKKREELLLDELLSIYTKFPLDSSLISPEDRSGIEILIKNVEHRFMASEERRFTEEVTDNTVSDYFHFRKNILSCVRDIEMATDLPASHVRLTKEQVERILRRKVATYAWSLFPEDVRDLPSVKRRKFSPNLQLIIDVNNSIHFNPNRFNKPILEEAEREERIRELLEGGVPKEEAAQIVEGLEKACKKRGEEMLAREWEKLPVRLTEAFSEPIVLTTVPILNYFTETITKLDLKDSQWLSSQFIDQFERRAEMHYSSLDQPTLEKAMAGIRKAYQNK